MKCENIPVTARFRIRKIHQQAAAIMEVEVRELGMTKFTRRARTLQKTVIEIKEENIFQCHFFHVPFRDHWMKNPGAAWKDQAWLALRTGNFSENYWTNCWWHLITWFESQSYGNPYDSDQDVGVYTVDDVPSIGATELTEEEAAAIASYESYFLTERGTVSIFVIRCS